MIFSLIFIFDCCLQETDDNEPQLEDATDPSQVVPQPTEPLPAERDVPVMNIPCFTSQTFFELL